eukprot:scaffold18435_cov113-Isochrysis_galbana.AAC.14
MQGPYHAASASPAGATHCHMSPPSEVFTQRTQGSRETLSTTSSQRALDAIAPSGTRPRRFWWDKPRPTPLDALHRSWWCRRCRMIQQVASSICAHSETERLS